MWVRLQVHAAANTGAAPESIVEHGFPDASAPTGTPEEKDVGSLMKTYRFEADGCRRVTVKANDIHVARRKARDELDRRIIANHGEPPVAWTLRQMSPPEEAMDAATLAALNAVADEVHRDGVA